MSSGLKNIDEYQVSDIPIAINPSDIKSFFTIDIIIIIVFYPLSHLVPAHLSQNQYHNRTKITHQIMSQGNANQQISQLICHFINIIMMQQASEQEQIQRLNEVRLRVRDEGIQPLRRNKSKIDETFILNCLKSHFIFYNLSDRQLENVKDYMFWAEMPPGVQIFRQGTVGTCFYIIVSGQVEIRIDQENSKTLKASDGFGQLALLYDIERPSTATTKDRCCFWIIDKTSFRESVEQIVISQFEANQKFLEGMAFYQFLRPRQKEKVASSFVTLKYYKGQNIIEEGDPGSAFYMIKDGIASLLQGNLEERKIYKGQSFGHNSLYYNTMRKMTVRAEEEVVVQVLGRQTLAKIIGPEYRQVMFKNYVKHIIQKNRTLFAMLKKDEQSFFEGMKIKYLKTNEVVFKKGTTVQRLVIVMEGKLKKFRSANYLAEAGQTWGESFLLDQNNTNIRLEDDIIVESESVIIELNLMAIRNIQISMSQIQKSQLKKIHRDILDVGSINYIAELERGNQSTIILLKFQQKLLAGKLYRKKDIQKHNIQQIVQQEREVSEAVQHPFLANYYQSVETEKYILRISEYVRGESLYDSIRQIGLLSTLDCQFYAACMILMLEYFMTQQIVIRDLKPDNFIIDERGYPKLISLGSAKMISNLHRTSTVIGTPHYMAPEIVLGKQYNELVDLWSVGVMLYQFMVGQLPFGGNTQNPYEIYESIIQGEVQFPRMFKDRRAKKIIETMLNLNPEARYNGSYNSLKSHSWFENIIWDDVIDKSMHAPYKPNKIREIKPSQPVNLFAYLDGL